MGNKVLISFLQTGQKNRYCIYYSTVQMVGAVAIGPRGNKVLVSFPHISKRLIVQPISRELDGRRRRQICFFFLNQIITNQGQPLSLRKLFNCPFPLPRFLTHAADSPCFLTHALSRFRLLHRFRLFHFYSFSLFYSPFLALVRPGS